MVSLRLIDEKNMSKISHVSSLSDKAYHAIRGLIVSLELAPGAVIDERELIERLQIGRTPVREALRRLAQERLVEVYPRRGMFVTGVDVRELARLSEVRVVLEPEAARLAAERATEADRAELTALIEELDAGGSELMGLDERNHRAVYRAAHNDLPEASVVPWTSRWTGTRGWTRGTSLSGSPAALGWKDCFQAEKGRFPNPGGSSGHASKFIFPVDHSREMAQLTLDSMKQYREAGTL